MRKKPPIKNEQQKNANHGDALSICRCMSYSEMTFSLICYLYYNPKFYILQIFMGAKLYKQ